MKAHTFIILAIGSLIIFHHRVKGRSGDYKIVEDSIADKITEWIKEKL